MKKVVPELFIKSAEQFKDHVAFNFFDRDWKSITYNEFLMNTKAVASHLIKSGIKKGDRVAIISENRHEWCTAYFAVSLSGGTGVPVDFQLGPAEIKNLLADSETKVVFHSAKTEGNIKKAAGRTVDYRTQAGPFESLQAALISFDSPEFINICRTPDIGRYPQISEEDVASIIYTSGTTGVPKGVMLTHRNFCSDAEAVSKAGILSHADSVVSVLPLHHTYPFMGNCLLPALLGIPVTYPQSLKGPDLMSAMREHGVTILVSVPQLLELIRNGIFNKMERLPGPLPKIMFKILHICSILRWNFNINPGKVVFKPIHRALGEKFRFFACGGAKLDTQVMKDLEALGFTVLEGYGLTETSPVVTFNPVEKRKPGSAGKPLPSAEIRITGPEKNAASGRMEEGEIMIRGPMVMKGYYKNPRATGQALQNGWFRSGDLGYMDEDGYLFITGRLKEVIVLSSGKNIYPDEVEKKYLQIPLIKEICVMGLEDKGVIKSLQAVIVPELEYTKKARTADIHEALKREINNVSSVLPQYMRIKGYTLYSEPLPRTPLGKLRRFMIKDLMRTRGKEQGERSEDKNLIRDRIGNKVIECITPLLREKPSIQASDDLELDLGFDSLARIELLVALEKAFSVKLPETFVAEAQTVGELVAKIKEYGTGEIREIEHVPLWGDILKAEPDPDDREKTGMRHTLFEKILIFLGLNLTKIIIKTFFRMKSDGIGNLPEKGPFIITPNHASYLDAFSVVSALPAKLFSDLYIIGFQRYFSGRFMEAFARLAHVIPVDPDTYINRALRMSSLVLRNRKSLLIFPEGGRSFNGDLMDFKKGVGILSIELDIPVVPTYIRGSFAALPREAAWPKFTKIHVSFGKPLRPSDVSMSGKPDSLDKYRLFANELRDRVKILRDRRPGTI